LKKPFFFRTFAVQLKIVKKFTFILWLVFCSHVSANTSRLDTFRFGPERPKIGVVLSGGGAKGMAHVGTLKMLETLNIPVDYIGGTSMGSVVGSLYAMGYTADQIDKIMRATDWTSLFNDFPNREHVGVHEKRNNDPYQLRLSLVPNEIAIFAKGVIDGQHIDNMLTHHLFEAYKTPNFSDLKIPFFAVAADLIAGQYIVLDSGNLAQAVRASMAVPTVFSPVEIDGRLLVDGGILNNFPVLAMRERGVDIIIGVDVGYQYKDKSELRNLANIFEQVMFMGGQDIQLKNKEDCDIVIVPNLEGLSAFNFTRYDTIMERGYQAAQAAYPELRRLADLLYEKYGEQNVINEPYVPIRTIILDTIILNDNDKHSDQFILSRLQLRTHRPIEINEIEEAIHRLFGSFSFTKVTYHFEKSPLSSELAILHINVQEAPPNTAKIGFRYDNIRGPSLLAGLTMRSPRNLNSEFNVNLDLSLLPIIDFQYRFSPVIGRTKKVGYSLWQPTFFTSYTFCHLRIYDYIVDTVGIRRNVEYGVRGHRAAIGTEFNVRNNVFGLGIYLDHTVSNERVGGIRGRLEASYLYPQFYFLRNSLNNRYYPSKGSVINARLRWLHTLEHHDAPDEPWVKRFITYYADVKYAFPFSKRLTVYPSAMIAGTIDPSEDYISGQQRFYQGGLYTIQHINHTPFVGLYFMQKSGFYGANVQVSTQYELFRNFYLTARIGALKSEKDYLEMFNLETTTFGAGLSASFNTTVGPIGITVHRSNESPTNVFINLGFWF
jgi:NTE family protein